MILNHLKSESCKRNFKRNDNLRRNTENSIASVIRFALYPPLKVSNIK